jgi:hypothetical protein
MEELSLGVKIAMILFGLGGVFALAIVPWACIGTGLLDDDKEYESHG